ncbi:hypothetical protein [Butyrivibrio sp. WCE2006]|uniref:hypothetical protein n=1 Tax=Butyrivibrio sp. WCE2006 TaxID=1410611 RepID=UPI0005D16B96|nr:hypothetical protein [Butyrivibrio sp. WCE2006]
MSGNGLTNAAAIREMIIALDNYMNSISDNMEYMKRAAIICTTAMSSDSISMEMVRELESSRKILESAVDEAARLKKAFEEELPDIEDKIKSISSNTY